MTLGEIKKASMALIEEYSDTAADQHTSDDDIARKLCPIINAAQMELAQIKKIRKSVKINNRLPENLLTQRGIFSHNDEDVPFSANKGRSYYFMIDDNATITIKVGGVTANTITHTAAESGAYEAVYGLISNSDNKAVEFVFSGDNYYTVKNFAIYAASFSSAGAIPAYSDYIEIALSSAFYQLESVRLRNGETVNALPKELEIKDKNTLLLHSEATGEYEIKYFAYPATITKSTSDDTELEIDEDAQCLIMYRVASDALKSDPSVDYTSYEKAYADKLSKLDPRNNVSRSISFTSLISGGNI